MHIQDCACVPYLPYLPDSFLCDFFLLPKLKIHLKGKICGRL